jgi:hypothetical protein
MTDTPANYDCPVCKAPGSVTIADEDAPHAQAVARAMMGGNVKHVACSACDKDGRMMPGWSDEYGLRVFARVHAEDAGLGLEPGKRYRIVWRSDLHRKDHESVMDFMGRAKGTPAALNFSARPVAGTQMLYADYIKSVTEVPESTRVVLSRVVSVTDGGSKNK